MAHGYDTMMTPAIEDLLERTESKFILVTLAAMRGREITNYFGQLGGGIGATVPPQVVSTSAKPLSIALEEIAAGKIEAVEVDENGEPLAEQAGPFEGTHLQDVSDPEQGGAGGDSSEPAGHVGA